MTSETIANIALALQDENIWRRRGIGIVQRMVARISRVASDRRLLRESSGINRGGGEGFVPDPPGERYHGRMSLGTDVTAH